MKKNGFTLIELLVVVAIIGILAAVGIVAYSGYTTSAKKNTIKSRHDTIVKFFKAEFEKCNINEEVYLANVNEDQCYRITDPTKRNLRLLRNIIILHINDTMEWKNVYDRDEDAATNKNLNAPNCDLGQICIKRDNINQRIIIASNYDDNNENYLTSYLELGD
jgi:type IV pilus assembly protein PilA